MIAKHPSGFVQAIGAWLDTVPGSLRDVATVEAWRAIVDLDLGEREGVQTQYALPWATRKIAAEGGRRGATRFGRTH